MVQKRNGFNHAAINNIINGPVHKDMQKQPTIQDWADHVPPRD